jgi:divalent metal cation (Fe/Co/Zn/Cd) transporter
LIKFINNPKEDKVMTGGGESKKAIYAALFGNLAIAISKLFAALFTGSTSMWAETYHSFSDTFNQVLLYFQSGTTIGRCQDKQEGSK